MARHDGRHLVVGQPGELRRDVGTAHHLQRRIGQGEDLTIVLVAIHDPEPLVEIHEHRDARHPLLQRHAGRRDTQHPVEVRPREDVGENVDLHRPPVTGKVTPIQLSSIGGTGRAAS
jgi:hypothetical protein